jgi:hypothetical protein
MVGAEQMSLIKTGFTENRSSLPLFNHQEIPLQFRGSLIDFLLIYIGIALNISVYADIFIILSGFIFFIAGFTTLMLLRWTGYWEQRTFFRMFLFGYLALGISGFYDHVLGGVSSLTKDAGSFYVASLGRYRDYSLADLVAVHEGGLAIKIWQAVYDGFAAFGIPKEHYIGILVNILAVTFSGVFAIRMAKLIYGNDSARLHRLFLMLSLCGLFWLFAGSHLRDALVLFFVTAMVGVWIWFLRRPTLGLRALVVAVVGFGSSWLMQFLRAEFFFLPLALAVAGIAAVLFSDKSVVRRVWRRMFLITLAPLVIGFVILTFSQVSTLLEQNAARYLDLRGGLQASENLGWVLTYQSPWYIQMIVRPVVMFVFPLPFWWGLQLDSAYLFFKGLATPFFYFLIPLGFVAVQQLLINPILRTPQQLFLLFTSVGMTLAIAFTSDETRHLGAFLVPIFLLLLIPDLHDHKSRRLYQLLLGGFLFVMALAHGFWLLRRL